MLPTSTFWVAAGDKMITQELTPAIRYLLALSRIVVLYLPPRALASKIGDTPLIPVPCYKCDKVFQAPDAFAGKKVRCTHCGDTLQVPLPGETPPAPATAAPLQPNPLHPPPAADVGSANGKLVWRFPSL